MSGFPLPSSPWPSHKTCVHDEVGLSKVGSTSRNTLTHFISIWWAGIFNLCNWKGQLSLCHLLLPCPRSKKAEYRLTSGSSCAYACSPAEPGDSVDGGIRHSSEHLHPALATVRQLCGQLCNLTVNFWDSIVTLHKLPISECLPKSWEYFVWLPSFWRKKILLPVWMIHCYERPILVDLRAKQTKG